MWGPGLPELMLFVFYCLVPIAVVIGGYELVRFLRKRSKRKGVPIAER